MKKILLLMGLFTLFLVSCGGNNGGDSKAGTDGAKKKKIKIGMSIDDLRLERWQKDRDLFKKMAESLGAEVVVISANGDSQK